MCVSGKGLGIDAFLYMYSLATPAYHTSIPPPPPLLLSLLSPFSLSPSSLPSLSLPPLSLLSLFLQILSTLATQPLQCLRPSEKVSVICLLIEDLLGSPALCREVDTKMEQISTLRREKWKINLKLKRCVGGRCWRCMLNMAHELKNLSSPSFSLSLPLPPFLSSSVDFSPMAPDSVLDSAVCLVWVRRNVWWCIVGVADLPRGSLWLGKEVRWVEPWCLGGWSPSGWVGGVLVAGWVEP